MRAPTAGTSLLLLSLLFAGCGDAPAPPETKPLESSTAPAPSSTLLRVLVITDEYLPIKDAKVSIVGLGLNGTTDEVGNAYFQIGEPGRYSVHVHRAGFYPNISKVTVDGEAKQVERITLFDAPRHAHFSDFHYFEGVCELTIHVTTVSNSSDCQDQGLFHRGAPRGWFLGEGITGGYMRLEWTHQPYGRERMRLELALPEAGPFADGRDVLVAEGSSPLIINITGDLITPAMKRNGIPVVVGVGLPHDEPVSGNVYQTFVIDSQFDYFIPAPDVDHH